MSFNDYKRFLNSAMGCGKTTAMCEAIVSYQEKNPDKVCTIIVMDPIKPDKCHLTEMLERLGADLDRIEFVPLEHVFEINREKTNYDDEYDLVTSINPIKTLPTPTFISHECYDYMLKDLLGFVQHVRNHCP